MSGYIATYKNPFTRKAGHQRIITAETRQAARKQAKEASARIGLQLLKLESWDGKF